MSEFVCEWGKCQFSTDSSNAMQEHIRNKHIAAFKGGRYCRCLWDGCPRGRYEYKTKAGYERHIEMEHVSTFSTSHDSDSDYNQEDESEQEEDDDEYESDIVDSEHDSGEEYAEQEEDDEDDEDEDGDDDSHVSEQEALFRDGSELLDKARDKDRKLGGKEGRRSDVAKSELFRMYENARDLLSQSIEAGNRQPCANSLALMRQARTLIGQASKRCGELMVLQDPPKAASLPNSVSENSAGKSGSSRPKKGSRQVKRAEASVPPGTVGLQEDILQENASLDVILARLPAISGEGSLNDALSFAEASADELISKATDVANQAVERGVLQQLAISFEDAMCIAAYSVETERGRSMHEVLNEALTRNRNEDTLLSVRMLLVSFLKSLRKLPLVSCPVIYRVVDKEVGDRLRVGTKCTFWGFTPALSRMESVGNLDGTNGTLLILEGPWDGYDIQEFSELPIEGSFLLEPETRFEVVEKSEAGPIVARRITTKPVLLQVAPRVSASASLRSEISSEEQPRLRSEPGEAVLNNLIKEFEGLPEWRKSGGRFVAHPNIWNINRDLAVIHMREIIRLFRAYPVLIDWSAKYSKNKTFTFGEPVSNDTPGNENMVACANRSAIWLGTKFFSQSLEEFRNSLKRSQRESAQNDGSVRSFLVHSNAWELESVRHEFGHVFQFLLQYAMAEIYPKYKSRDIFCEECKQYLMNIAKTRGLDETAREMSQYGSTESWEWFAESFANSQNAIDGSSFQADDRVSPEENRRMKKLMNEARIVGEYAQQVGTDFGRAHHALFS